MLRVDLRLPDAPAATDAAVISRFTESLKAVIVLFTATLAELPSPDIPQRCGVYPLALLLSTQLTGGNFALDAYPRVLMLRVDLRLPDAPAATDAAVISRFTERSPNSRAQTYRSVVGCTRLPSCFLRN
jgi:hypothetical protein